MKGAFVRCVCSMRLHSPGEEARVRYVRCILSPPSCHAYERTLSGTVTVTMALHYLLLASLSHVFKTVPPPPSRSQYAHAINAAANEQNYATCARLKAEMDALLAELDGEPQLMPACLLKDALEYALEREEYERAAAIRAEMGLACKLSPSGAFTRIWNPRHGRSSQISCRLDDASRVTLRNMAETTAAPAQTFETLRTPSQWPELALFSSKVFAIDMAMQRTVTDPLQAGAIIKEVAGAPPLIPVRFTWICRSASPEAGVVTLESVGSDAGDCLRSYLVESNGVGGSRVTLESTYSAPSPVFQIFLRIDALFFSFLLNQVANSGVPSAKQCIVWGGLLFGWAVSSLGWMSLF